MARCKSTCRCTTISPRSRRNGAASRNAPTARCSRPSTGYRRGCGISAIARAVKPVIVIGRHQGAILFVMPFALDATGRTLGWLGSSLCNYNGPLLARDFSRRVSPAQFLQIWRQVKRLLRSRLGHDLIDLEKMPETIGEQRNPFCALHVTPHMNNAYLSALGTDWETYYAGKRSSATRRSDRKKQRRLSEHGEVKFLTAANRDDDRAHARCADRGEDRLLRQARRRQHVRAAGLPRLLPRPGNRRAKRAG